VLSSEKFRPEKWQPSKQNTAFKYLTKRDALWAADILSRYSDEDIADLVTMAGYKDPKIQKRIASELITRRDKITGYWFKELNPLHRFSFNRGILSFTDPAFLDGTRYRYRLRRPQGSGDPTPWKETLSPEIITPKDKKSFVVQIQTIRPDQKWWSSSIDVYFMEKDSKTVLLGINRRTDE